MSHNLLGVDCDPLTHPIIAFVLILALFILAWGVIALIGWGIWYGLWWLLGWL